MSSWRDCCQHCCQAAGQRPSRADSCGMSAHRTVHDGRSWTMCPLLRIRRSSARQADGASVLAGLRSGDGPLSIRVRPSSLKHDCDRRTTSTGERCLVNVHAKSRLTLEPTDTPGKQIRVRQEPARADADHPLHGAGGHRAGSKDDDRMDSTRSAWEDSARIILRRGKQTWRPLQ